MSISIHVTQPRNCHHFTSSTNNINICIGSWPKQSILSCYFSLDNCGVCLAFWNGLKSFLYLLFFMSIITRSFQNYKHSGGSNFSLVRQNWVGEANQTTPTHHAHRSTQAHSGGSMPTKCPPITPIKLILISPYHNCTSNYILINPHFMIQQLYI